MVQSSMISQSRGIDRVQGSYMYMYMYMYMYVCIYVCMHVCIYIYTDLHM